MRTGFSGIGEQLEASMHIFLPDKAAYVYDGKRVCYLLMHLVVPSSIMPLPSEKSLSGLESAEEAAQVLGIKVRVVKIMSGHRHLDFRYLFRFLYYARDDETALRIAESILYGVAIVSGPIVESHQTDVVFRIPLGLFNHGDIIQTEHLVLIDQHREPGDRLAHYAPISLGSAVGVSATIVDAAWRIAPVLVANDGLHRAAQFLKASLDCFYVAPSRVPEVLGMPDQYPKTSLEQTNLENALQNAFKCLEAILGDPPKDDRKLFSRLQTIGLDPCELVGYRSKSPLHTVIRDMNTARDKKSAHGSTGNRAISISEITEYQACANLVLSSAIETVLGESIF